MVTNFGLLRQGDAGWQLTCEEVIGGLLLEVQGDAANALVSTDTGLFLRSPSACEWASGPVMASNRWALDVSLAHVESGDARAQFALVIDAETQQIHVEESAGNADFSVLHSFESTSGYRELEAAGEPASIFVAGYTYSPRTWHLAFSLDAGASWDQVAPVVDNELATMVLALVDPQFPRAVFIRAETTAGQGDELWRFDAESGQIERLLILQEGEIFGGIALDGDSLWVAGRRRSGGSLYRSTRDALEFQRVVNSGPAFECLAAHDGVLYACVNDFTHASEFILGSSMDDGETWTKRLTVQDLGAVASSCADCSPTLDWLHGTYGVADGSAGAAGGEAASGTAATGGAAGLGAAGQPANDDRGKASSGKTPSGGGCQLAASPRSAWPWHCLMPLAAWCAGRRRRARRRLAPVGASLLLFACSESAAVSESADAGAQAGGAAGAISESADPEPAEANCAGRGDDLSQLEMRSDNNLQLRLLALQPDPPAVGDNSWLVELSDSQGKAISGLADALFVTPFMPDHGHGTPVSVGITEEAAGQYRLAPVNTFMPGLWQISLDIAGTDSSERFQFSVCVE